MSDLDTGGVLGGLLVTAVLVVLVFALTFLLALRIGKHAIVDVVWNGFLESLKIASMADVYEVNVAPHNFYGHLASAISAHYCAAVPNFRIMEIDIDSVTWRDDFVKTPPVIENGDYILPTGPGWGVEVNEPGLRAHPAKQRG